jgi:hypothetical protein
MKKKVISNKSRTDWKRLKTMTDKDIDLSDIPELTPRMFACSILRREIKAVAKK